MITVLFYCILSSKLTVYCMRLFSQGSKTYSANSTLIIFTANALNHIWEGIMYYEITRDMIKCGGLHPISVHTQEYKEIKSEHFWGLQQAREEKKIQDAIRFYKVRQKKCMFPATLLTVFFVPILNILHSLELFQYRLFPH